MPQLSRRIVVAGLLATAGCSVVRTDHRARTGPPLWRVSRGSSQVLLFGQMPIPQGVHWLTPEIASAFNDSEEVWFENPEFEPTAAGATMRKRIALGGPKLGEVVDGADRRRLSDALQRAGRSTDAFDVQLTWQAYLSIADLVDALSGNDPRALPERTLKDMAKRSGKRVRSEWTSLDEIMTFSARQTPQQQLQLISRTLDDVESPDAARAAANAWAAGDIAQSTEENTRLTSKYPELTASILIERNARWVARVADMLERNHSTFVCIGLGHLVGPNSVQSHLTRAGLQVTRI